MALSFFDDTLFIRCKCYIIAGIFPSRNSAIELARVRDMFSNLTQDELIELICDADMRESALKLLRLIYSNSFIEDLTKVGRDD